MIKDFFIGLAVVTTGFGAVICVLIPFILIAEVLGTDPMLIFFLTVIAVVAAIALMKMCVAVGATVREWKRESK